MMYDSSGVRVLPCIPHARQSHRSCSLELKEGPTCCTPLTPHST
nr:MAG TPA: hypothetical protein [Caudoviricetes sp.]